MKKIFKIFGLSAGALFVFYSFYLLWQQSQPVPVVYEIVEPAVRDIKLQTVATGKIDPRHQVNVKPQTTGIITELNVQPGDYVKLGQVVAKIKVIPDMGQLDQVKSKIESELINLREVERKFNRTKSLFDKGVVSREEYEAAETNLHSAQEGVEAAKSQLEVVTTGSSARSGSINTTIVFSTMSGTVLSLPVKVGSSVSATSMFSDGTTICTVADMSDVLFNGNIDETDVAKIHIDMPITLTLGSMQDLKIDAHLEYISPEGVEKNGAIQFEVKAKVNIPKGVILRSGYSVNAEIVLAEAKQVLSIDESCISFEDKQAYVWRLTSNVEDSENQQWEKVPVEIGLSDGLYMQIKSGVDATDKFKGNKK